jgi:hypothetical protein
MDVNLPSQTEDHKAQEVTKDAIRKHHILTSMHVIYGGAIIILAVVVSGIVCALGNVRIPYVSDFYSPVLPSPYVIPVHQNMLAPPVSPVASTSTAQAASSTIATSTHKKL